MKQITRDRPLTPEEIAEDRRIREEIEQEMPELIARHPERTAARLAAETVTHPLNASPGTRQLPRPLPDVALKPAHDKPTSGGCRFSGPVPRPANQRPPILEHPA